MNKIITVVNCQLKKWGLNVSIESFKKVLTSQKLIRTIIFIKMDFN